MSADAPKRKPVRPPWDFPYAAVPNAAADDDGGACNVIVATEDAVSPEAIVDATRPLLGDDAAAETVIARAPLYWTALRATRSVYRASIVEALVAAGIAVRYVASASRSSLKLGPSLRYEDADVARPSTWKARGAPKTPPMPDPPSDGRWFLRDHGGGIAVDRNACGLGAGTRLAVIDDDGAEADHLDLDAEIAVGMDRVTRATSHGALMVAWAVGCRGEDAFRGVAPLASPRLYCIPKPGREVVSLPLAIARAVLDGADVVVCATYVEGGTSPMLDDALDVARRLGRRGRGTVVVLPTGREASSAAESLHSAWTLALGDPACDPRVFCIGPSARDDGWFLWSDRKGKLRPFANRGPSLRWLAPGDDVAYPFGDRDRLFHAESSGASAIAAGVVLLVIAANPSLRPHEIDAIITRTVDPLDPLTDARRTPLADAFDVLPTARDEDGHSAKLGYGRMHAARACVAARDPIALTLLTMGERSAALATADASAGALSVLRSLHSARKVTRGLARFIVRALLADASAAHSLKAIARHARLVSAKAERHATHGEGALARQVVLFLRALERNAIKPQQKVARELRALIHDIEHASPVALENGFLEAFRALITSRESSTAKEEGCVNEENAARFGSDDVRL